MTLAIGIALIGLLAMLAAFEVARYRRAALGDEELPYPRRRLVRRIGVSLIFSLLILLVCYWPSALPAGVQLLLMLLTLLGIGLGLALLWRDLHETSRAVVRHAVQMDQQSGRDLLRTFTPGRSRAPGQPPEVDSNGENGKTGD